jgi:TPR repeat protein
VAEQQARLAKGLKLGIAALVVALRLALAVNTVPVRHAVTELAQALGFAPVTPIDAALAAYGKGDYAKASRLSRPLAENGDARAQSMLGLLYLHGRGVPQDDLGAAYWFRLDADQGEARAQFNLWLMYAEGRAVLSGAGTCRNWAQCLLAGEPDASFGMLSRAI